ncbi:MAG: enoyl-CoA hydratase/isomerase family protein, partial [Alphaproteobacteria bacterium]|nr:enoyl-CoA hydratase/isomerase family protein [Alphaproteobacteria bacterium]
MSFARLRYAAAGGRATIVLCTPERMNPLDWTAVRELRTAVALAVDDPAVRAVVVTGEGRAFSAGGDLEGYLTLYRDPAGFRAFLDDF